MWSPVTFGWASVAAELRAARLGRHLTIRDLAREVDCDHTVIFRLERATPVAVEHLLSLLLWLGRDPFQFTSVDKRYKAKLSPAMSKKVTGHVGARKAAKKAKR
ncbi:MAG TPA: helix-turn-helix transcriptional regulator [Nordella sp.]|nr:helix-turn-helix transcriptional regulator [Nordella sp.]